ncbi:MAG: selenocysteine-specific translation elongation factor [bacterium]
MPTTPVSSPKRHIVVGTAGHIDHGKSALIKALTGYDPDRLKEEKERGMTTDLGFAFLREDVTIIDVPGHEKFVRHMVAGASTIDFVLFVIAADDGPMPQTVEHLEVLKLLEISKGIIVITKKDMVKDDWLQMVTEDIKKLFTGSFLENAPIVTVSSTTGEGIEDLRKILDELIDQTQAKKDRGIFRLPVDRCFTIKGFGTVVAGTVLSGKLKIGDTLELLPCKKKVKVRGIQVHNEKVEEVSTGFRAAINLVGVEKDEIERGDIIAQPGFYEPSDYLNVSIYLLKSAEKPLKNLTRLRIHIGTKEILGRIVLLDKKILKPGEKAMAQFRLEKPAVSDVGDRYVIRTYSPQTTIGGGSIIEPKAIKVKGFDEQLIEHLQKVETGDTVTMVEENLLTNFKIPQKADEIAHDLNIPPAEVKEIVENLISENRALLLDKTRGLYYAQSNLEKLNAKILDVLKSYHQANPTNIGIPRLELLKSISKGMDKSLMDYALNKLSDQKIVRISDDNKISSSDFKVVLNKELDAAIKKIEKLFLDSGYKPPSYAEILEKRLGDEKTVKKAHRYMIDTGILVSVGESIVFHNKYIAEAEENLIGFLKKNKEMRISQFRDMLGASRKFVLPLLIYFDTHNITIKRGDVRILGQKYR